MSFSANTYKKGLLQLINNITPKNLMLIHGDFDAMKKFKEICQTQIPAKIITPGNKENVSFNESPKYEQVSISRDLLNVLETLEKIKNIKIKNININNIVYNDKKNIFSLKKIKLFGKPNKIINNKINIVLKNEKAFDIFINVIKLKDIKSYNDYIYLSNNNYLKYTINNNEEGEKKIILEYQYSPNTLDGNVINQKCLNIIKIFQMINKVL